MIAVSASLALTTSAVVVSTQSHSSVILKNRIVNDNYTDSIQLAFPPSINVNDENGVGSKRGGQEALLSINLAHTDTVNKVDLLKNNLSTQQLEMLLPHRNEELASNWNDNMVALNYDMWRNAFPSFASLIYAKTSSTGRLELHMVDSAFLYQELPTNFWLPEGLVNISDYAFLNNLSDYIRFKLPSTVSHIGFRAFAGTVIVPSFSMTEGHKSLTTVDARAFENSKVYGTFSFPSKTTVAPTALTNVFYDFSLYMNGKSGKVVEETYDHNYFNRHWNDNDIQVSYDTWVKNFPSFKDKLQPLVKITIGSVTQNRRGYFVRDNAFKNVDLPKNFYLPDGVLGIGAYAFANDIQKPLKFRLPRTVERIDAFAFQNAVLDNNFEIEYAHELKAIGSNAFSNTTGYVGFSIDTSLMPTGEEIDKQMRIPYYQHNLVEWTRSNVVMTIDFQDKSSYNFKTITALGRFKRMYPNFEDKIIMDFSSPHGYFENRVVPYAFTGQVLPVGFQLPFGTAVIGEYAFSDLRSTINFQLPDSIRSIENSAFQGVSIESAFGWNTNSHTSDNVTYIGDKAFYEANVYEGFKLPRGNYGITIGSFADAKMKKLANYVSESDLKLAWQPSGTDVKATKLYDHIEVMPIADLISGDGKRYIIFQVVAKDGYGIRPEQIINAALEFDKKGIVTLHNYGTQGGAILLDDIYNVEHEKKQPNPNGTTARQLSEEQLPIFNKVWEWITKNNPTWPNLYQLNNSTSINFAVNALSIPTFNLTSDLSDTAIETVSSDY